MDRKGQRGAKPKNVPPPAKLFTLGVTNKTGRPDSILDLNKPSSHGHSSNYAAGKSSDRGRDGGGPSALLGKKSKPGGPSGQTGVQRPGGPKSSVGDMGSLLTDEWETAAADIDPNDLIPFVEAAEESRDFDRIEALLCGAVKTLRSQRTKPDNLLCCSLMYLVKTKPQIFRADLVVEAFCSLLKRDHSMTFKSKGNATVSILATNILLAAYQEEKTWPILFLRIYIEDSVGERMWVDQEDCKGFVDNIVAAFRTKLPHKSLPFSDLGIGNRPDCPSPPIGSSGGDSGDFDSDVSLECRENLDINITNRYAGNVAEVEELVLEAVQHHLGIRHQSPDAVARSFIRYLSSVCGILRVRHMVAPKLESWLQSPKLHRPATDLLMSLCLNCNTHSQYDIECISLIIRIRLKHKPLINQYMTCLKELLGAHPDNVASVMKHTLYNELSQTRNPSNMSILSAVFQFAPEYASIILAEEFQELLCNREDFLRALRALLREIVRALRYDLHYQKFCQGLMNDRKDPSFRDNFEFKDRMFHSITDLIVLTLFVSISPQVRESAALMYRGETRDAEHVRRHQELVSNIQRDAMLWLYRVVPKCYNPSKEEFSRCLHKLLMLDQAESYYNKDNWPPESDRQLYFRLISEVPVKQETVTRLLMIAVTKDQWMKAQDLLELADKLIKRATSLHFDDVEVLKIEDIKIVELIFNLCPYLPPENSPLPPLYRPPKTAIANLYWKAWTMLLLVTAHNSSVFGLLAWETYPTLRAMMEMCITNSFVFPPPTLASGEKGEEMSKQELHTCALERQQILDFESHLAQKTITEQNSLLLSQLITMDPTGPARKPPVIVLEQLKALNASHKIGHLLCRSRNPDFLLDIIQRQGASQSMPWLAELVESSEGAFSVLPVQCLCEFLLSESGMGGSMSDVTATRHQQLLQHLRSLLQAPQQEEGASVEILEYFLRRLSSQQASSRSQAVRGLQLVITPSGDPMDVDGEQSDAHAWLLQHLPKLPGFEMVQSVANQALRAACQIETDPLAVSAYIRFLAMHTRDEPLNDQCELVQDMAQLIVERSTMISAILPVPDRSSQPFPQAHSTLKALLIIFINYMRCVRVPLRESYSWSENQDQIRIQWVSGEQAIMHILVVHAMVILLTYGPDNSPDLFYELLSLWFPQHEEMPQAFLVDTSEEALLLPDWLKLKMIRSTVPQLVDAALKDLEPSQLVLFIQSFGIPVASMTKLLCALDIAVNTSEEAVAAAVLDKSHKTYMAQLVEVQHQRGACGGYAFAATLGDRDDLEGAGERPPAIKPLVTSLQVPEVTSTEINQSEVQSFVLQCFTNPVLHSDHPKQVQETMRVLQRHLGREISQRGEEQPYMIALLSSLQAILQSQRSAAFVEGLHLHFTYSASLFRLLRNMHNKESQQEYSILCALVTDILHLSGNTKSSLTNVLQSFHSDSRVVVKEKVIECDMTSATTILNHLMAVAPQQLEAEIRLVVAKSMKAGVVSEVVGALTLLLVNMSSVKLNPEEEQSWTEGHLALLLDWLQVLDPELLTVPVELRQPLLFGQRGKGSGGKSQAYLLAAFTHQAQWDTLERTVRGLLRLHNPALNPASVLNFLWALLHVPKLWQGRERRQPRHSLHERLLHLHTCEVIQLAEYVMAECRAACDDKHEAAIVEMRLPLVLHCIEGCQSTIEQVTEHLASAALQVGPKREAARLLLYQLYLKLPQILPYIPEDALVLLVDPKLAAMKGASSADVALHTLLTMLSTPQHDKEFKHRMQDMEAALRKLAATHPILVLRHLPMMGACLHGMSHMDLAILRSRNYLDMFMVMLGVLELLQPHMFAPQHHTGLTSTLDAFFALLSSHRHAHELVNMLLRLCHLILGWVGARGGAAGVYLCTHAELLTDLQNHHPNMAPLRSLAAAAAARGSDDLKDLMPGTGESEIVPIISEVPSSPPLPGWVMAQVNDLQSRLDSSSLPDEKAEVLHKILSLTDRSYSGVLCFFTHRICEGLSSCHQSVRMQSWELLSRLLHRQPNLGDAVAGAVLGALDSDSGAIVETALEHLPEVVLLLHQHAPLLITAAFTASLTTAPSSSLNAAPSAVSSISEALTLLNLHTGA
ncbi:integrator complex subunit 1 [Oratosquilla oratoria]|uniref:integrator complex subunit 1 n=1 Tax=Oratosquilla oratoria TaxID=337810 RepID=UPI003F766723